MPTDLKTSLVLEGTSTIKGEIGPRTFARTLPQLACFEELETTVAPGDTDVDKPFPTIANVAFLFVRTDLPCSFKKGVEATVHSLDSGGEYLEIGSLGSLGKLVFTGSGAPKASVYIAVGGS